SDDEAATRPVGEGALPQTEHAVSHRPPLTPIPIPRQTVTDQDIEIAIRRGIKFLLTRFSAKTFVLGVVENPPLEMQQGTIDRAHLCGENALAVYALMQCGLAVNDPRLSANSPMMNGLIEAMKRLPCDVGRVSYARGVR